MAQTNLNLTEGSIQETGRPLDLALQKSNQFFQVKTAGSGSTAYTRDGAFYLSPSANNPNELNLVNQDGDYVLGKNGQFAYRLIIRKLPLTA